MDCYSRRRLLAYGASAFALAPAIAHADLASLPALPETANGSPDAHNRLTMETYIDGQGPYRFVVDTGADRSVIATDVAASLGLVPNRDVVVQGIVRALPAPTVQLKNLSFGNIAMDSLAAPVLPRKWLGADGFLGLDVIDGRRVTFDFVREKLTVARSGDSTGWQHSNEVIVRANGTNGRLKAIDCTVEDVPATAFIDSGAQISICNSPLFDLLQKRGTNYAKDAFIPLMGATGGQVMGRLAPISKIKLGSIVFSKSRLAISDLNIFNLWNLADKPALFIGMDFLQQMSAFTIDYRNKELRFKLANYMPHGEPEGRLARL
jgi:predicted aspartyl protease